MITLHVTKYALTKGIYEVVASETGSPGMYKYRISTYDAYLHKGQYEFTVEEAVAKVKLMAAKKKRSLLAKIAKLEKRFGV